MTVSSPDEDVTLQDTDRVTGRAALVGNARAALAVAAAVRSTLGPKGMDKMLIDQNGDVLITNDGATVLDTAKVEHPTAKLVIETSITQDKVARDGTTTSILILAELLRNALELSRSGLHPTIIADSYRSAYSLCMEEIDSIARPITSDEDVRNIVSTCIGQKVDSSILDLVCRLALDASESIEVDDPLGERLLVKRVSIEEGAVTDTELISAFVAKKQRFDKSMSNHGGVCSIAIIDGGLEIPEVEFDTELEISSLGIREGFIQRKKEKLERLVSHLESLNVGILAVRDGVDEEAQGMLRRAGINCYRRFDKEDLHRLSEITGATIVRSIETAESVHLGHCDSWEERKVSGVHYLHIFSNYGRGRTLMVRGSTSALRDEVIRTFDDALGVAVRVSGKAPMLPGGGSTWSHLARMLRNEASKHTGKRQLAIEGFADALETIPRVLAQNSGHDPIDRILELSAAQMKSGPWTGFDLMTDNLVSLDSIGVIDLRMVVENALSGATEGAISVLRIDDVLWAKVEPGEPDWNQNDDED